MKTATRKTGMISGSQATRMAKWLDTTHDYIESADEFERTVDVTERILAKYPKLRQPGRVASFLRILYSGDILVLWS